MDIEPYRPNLQPILVPFRLKYQNINLKTKSYNSKQQNSDLKTNNEDQFALKKSIFSLRNPNIDLKTQILLKTIYSSNN